MATVTTPARRTPRNLAESHTRCRHPLERLRGYIRTYVALEGVTVFFVYLALWFWIGLLLDYGFFQVTGIDWVQEDTRGWVRGILLAVLALGLVGLVAGKVVFRLLTEFSDAALALVLERRFPKKLGDRLITAVELADPKKAAKLGYSEVMIEETIHDAAERVGTLPVQEVFNWKRLRRQGLLVGFLIVGMYLLVGVGYSVGDVADDAFFTKERSPSLGRSAGNYLWGFPEVAGTWFERNILLRNIIWPRRAHLEILDFPGDELRIGRNADAPGIRVRALKWVLADSSTPEGWRALRWSDLTPQLLGADMPNLSLPTSWQPRDPKDGLTLDEIDLQVEKIEQLLDQEDARDKMSADDWIALHNLAADYRTVLDQLDTQAGKSSNKRTLRKLKIPGTVYVKYKGENGRGELTLQKQEGNEYTGQFNDLKETITFRAQGEDYYTPSKRIVVVPPPTLDGISTDQYRPAYIYYRTPRGVPAERMKGAKQLFEDVKFSTMGGEKTVIDVPIGTDVVLTAKASKPLDEVRFVPSPATEAELRRKKQEIKQPAVGNDPHSFQVRFDNVDSRLDFTFEFTDTDGVTGSRKVEIKPILDANPEVSIVVEGIRKTAQGYLCTVSAFIPFRGDNITDDHGLEDLEYGYTLTRLETGVGEQGSRAIFLLSALYLLPGGPGHDLLAATQLQPLVKGAKRAEEKKEYRPVRAFSDSLSQHPGARLPDDPNKWAERLRQSPPVSERALMKSFKLDPEIEIKEGRKGDKKTTFDVEKLGLKVPLVTDVQPRYRLTIWLEATDNDIETGPHRGSSKETYTVLLVSENELLSEIVKEEDNFYLKFADMVNKLEASNRKLADVKKDLASDDLAKEELDKVKDQLRKMSDRIGNDVVQPIEQGRDVAEAVKNDYLRILAEMEINRIREDHLKTRRQNIVYPLEDALAKEFEQAKKALNDYRAVLESEEPNKDQKLKSAQIAAREAELKMEALLKLLRVIRANMEGVADLGRLIKALVEIADEEKRQLDNLRKIHDDLEKKLIDLLLKGQNPKEEEKPKKEEKKP